MRTSATLTLAGLALSTAVAAVPNVTVVPLTDGCASYPGWDASTGVAGPWIVEADSTGTSIDGHGDTNTYSLGTDSIRWGFITIPVNNQLAKNPLRCTGGVLQGDVATGVSGYSWQPLVAATSIPYDATFGYMFPGNNSAVEPYAHYQAGVKQDGVFLGANNVTTWGFTYTSDDQFGEYYTIRLLGPGSENPTTGAALNAGEVAGFIKVYA